MISRRFCLYVIISAVLFQVSLAHAAEPRWSNAEYRYVVVDQDLRGVLQQFGLNNGLRISLSDKVQGRVRGQLSAASPRDYLQTVARHYGLDWIFDGAVLTISATSEAQTQTVALGGVPLATLRDRLAASDLLDERFPLRPGLGADTVLVSGPPRYAALVREAAEALAGERKPQAPAPRRKLVIVHAGSVTEVRFP